MILIIIITINTPPLPGAYILYYYLPCLANISFIDGGGARNLAGCRENGVNHIAERGHEPSTQSDSGKTENNTTLPAIRFILLFFYLFDYRE